MSAPLMPKATAVWLIENTSLTFKQIADFCHMHELEIKGIADGEVAQGIIGVSPIVNGQVTLEEIERCQKDKSAYLKLVKNDSLLNKNKVKSKAKYTPIARRQDKPDAIFWLLKQCPHASDAQISKLIGTTKSTIAAIRNKEHWNMQDIRQRDPVLLGLCSQSELNKFLAEYELKYSDSKDTRAEEK